MVHRFHRWMSSLTAVALLGLALIAWTWATLGPGAAWRMAGVLAGLGLADAALGQLRRWRLGDTLSEEVNRGWHRDPWRYWFWLVGLGVGLVMLHLHFTGV